MSRFGDFFRRIGEESRQKPTINAGPFGGTTSDGLAITSFSSGAVELIRLGDSISTLHAIYREQWAVRTCVNFLAWNMAHLKLKTYRRIGETEREPVKDHPLPRLLANPNPQTSSFELIRDLVSDLAIYMNSYWWKATSGGARRLIRIPPSVMQPRGGSVLTGPNRYEVTTESGVRTLSPDEIVHIKGYNPLDPREGSPILWSLKAVLNEEREASRHRAGYWKHAARREGVLEFPEGVRLSDDAFTRLHDDWENRTAGANNAGKTAIIEDGGRFRDTSFSPRDSEFIAGRQWGLDTVATAFQIPLAMLSRTNTATFASVKEFHTVLYVDVLGSWSAMIESALALQLVPDYDDPDIYVEFNIDEKLQGDFEGTADAMRSSIQVPWMSVNDGRAIRNMPRIDDPDFDVPAKATAYLYGDQQPAAPVAPVVPLAPAASNGHSIDAELELLTRSVEVPDE